MALLLRQADVLLRARSGLEATGRSLPLGSLARTLLVFGAFYGAVMGSFGGLGPERVGQVVISAVKAPFLLVATFGLSLPSFFVLNTLVGLRSDFPRAVRALVAAQAGLTVILASLAPFTALWYVSTTDYGMAVLFNAAMFGLASLGAQGILRREYRPLLARNPRHRWLLRVWLVIYAFVGIQMGWLLRPFVGAPNQPVQIFRSEAWDNAYVIVARLVWEAITR